MSSNVTRALATISASAAVRYPLGRGAELAYSPLTGSSALLTGVAPTVLDSCARFGTPSDHLAHLPEQLKGTASEVADCLKALGEAGMTLTIADLVARTERFGRVPDSPVISWLTIPTANRPYELSRALESYAANCSRFNRTMRFLVSDHSEYGGRSARKEASEQTAHNVCQRVFYLDDEERRRFASLLSGNHEIPPEVIDFGLFGPTGRGPTFGANRNTILLATAGDLLFTVDDDTICRPLAPAEADVGGLIRLGAEGDPSEFWFYPSRDAALRSLTDIDIDVFAAHEQFLGKPIWAVFRTAHNDLAASLETACGHLIESIWSGVGEVQVTLNGLAGDSGLFSGTGLRLQNSPGTRHRLVSSESAYVTALQSREMVRQTLAPTVCHGGPFLSMFVGLDNRKVLPPFFPVFRNEDGIFGIVLSRCADHSYSAHLPWSMVHAPATARQNHVPEGDPIRMSDLVILAISTWNKPCRGMGIVAALESLGRHLVDIGTVAQRDFIEQMRLLLFGRAAHRISEQLSLLKVHSEQPAFWAEDMKRGIDRIAKAVVEPDYGVVIDLLGNRPPDELWHEAQTLIRHYGELLRWWPSICDQAKSLALAERLPWRRCN